MWHLPWLSCLLDLSNNVCRLVLNIDLFYLLTITYCDPLLNNFINKKNCWDVLIWVTGHCNRAAVSRNRYSVEKTVDKCNKILCLSSRNMIDKTMCEVLWRIISDFYVNLRVEVGKHPQVLIWVWTATFSQVILAMYFYLGQE